MTRPESRIEQERRARVERQERFKDLQEDYERRLPSCPPDERRQLKQWFSDERRKYREAEVALGKRLPGTHVATQQIMWARWLEVAIEHELEARQAYLLIKSDPGTGLTREFPASLVAVSATAHTVEALFGDIKYRIPRQPLRKPRHSELRHAFQLAFGIPDQAAQRLANELQWVFASRDQAIHPYTELLPTRQHPSGIHTGEENSWFNAVTSSRAVETAMGVMRWAASPPQPHSRWVERWAVERQAYFERVADLQRERQSAPSVP